MARRKQEKQQHESTLKKDSNTEAHSLQVHDHPFPVILLYSLSDTKTPNLGFVYAGVAGRGGVRLVQDYNGAAASGSEVDKQSDCSGVAAVRTEVGVDFGNMEAVEMMDMPDYYSFGDVQGNAAMAIKSLHRCIAVQVGMQYLKGGSSRQGFGTGDNALGKKAFGEQTQRCC
ncbi:hypothetical protein EJ04DRAFT_553694 [Polyplosphaeria fusca]|uniref:Uncharacterized protein n=1 Tax=Polyplosphaeria fusca TaxID=682080 RepID=A0A9P4QUH9_9PLEO|nr:hypothetical protein EJ04DRAFT_553694 [Polyplosphaeria fusca]